MVSTMILWQMYHHPSDDMILFYTGGSWTCGYDDVLDSADVIAIVENESDIT